MGRSSGQKRAQRNGNRYAGAMSRNIRKSRTGSRVEKKKPGLYAEKADKPRLETVDRTCTVPMPPHGVDKTGKLLCSVKIKFKGGAGGVIKSGPDGSDRLS